jgi:uncharacterized membrane protein
MAGKLVLYGLIGGLAISGVLNAVLLGSITKRSQSPTAGQGDAVQVVRTDGPARPISAEVSAAWAKVPEADRKEMGAQFGELRKVTMAENERMEDAAKRIAEIARTEPYDGGALRDTVVVYRHIQQGLQQRVDDILISHLAKMPPEARETAARGLLTPYFQWMRPPRKDGQGVAPGRGQQGANGAKASGDTPPPKGPDGR